MELLILPFDHRASLLKKLFGVADRKPTREEMHKYAEMKKIIYDGFLQAIKEFDKNKAAILVDEEFGYDILIDAKKRNIITIYTIEKSGQEEFDFEYEDWQKHVKKIQPDYGKVLVRFNPSLDNSTQIKKLKKANDGLKELKTKFLFELLVPGTEEQLSQGQEYYDEKIRPKLMVEAISQLQKSGIEPDVWKLEGVNSKKDAEKLVLQTKQKKCEGIVILGRGQNKEAALKWVEIGAETKGVVGFAVGRTIFWDAIKGFNEGKMTRKQAVDLVCSNYLEFVKQWSKKHG
ncbi:DUF2090 domain-containing protein [Candidatus Micrarchaeota archaeon]|nr:DUF2090 domain-containing protein [Candidatus Micrarchaeota archaeon]